MTEHAYANQQSPLRRQLRLDLVDATPGPQAPPHTRRRPAPRRRKRRNYDQLPLEFVARPKTRADCIGGQRPCPFLSCRHHLMSEVLEETGSVIFTSSGGRLRALRRARLNPKHHSAESIDDKILEALFDGRETCSLDVADRGAHTRLEIGGYLAVSDEEIRRREASGLASLRAKIAEQEAREQ